MRKALRYLADWSAVLFEVCCVAAIAFGVGLIFFPAGLIVAGVLGVAGSQAYARASRPSELDEVARKLRAARQRAA